MQFSHQYLEIAIIWAIFNILLVLGIFVLCVLCVFIYFNLGSIGIFMSFKQVKSEPTIFLLKTYQSPQENL